MISSIKTLSHSAMSLYLECGRKYRYRYLDHVASPRPVNLVFGSAVHKALGDYFRARQSDDAFDLSSAWDSAFDMEAKTDVDWGGELPELVRKDGLTLLSSRAVGAGLEKLDLMKDSGGDLVLERKINWRVDGVDVPIIGYLDAITADGTTLDFKTARRRWTRDQAEAETQPLFYLAALTQAEFPHAAGEFKHVVLIKTKEPAFQVIDTVRTAEEINWLAGATRHVWRGISQGDFPPNPSSCFKWGKRCAYFEHCRKDRS